MRFTPYEEMIRVFPSNKGIYRRTVLKRLGWRQDYQDNGYCQGILTYEQFDLAIELALKNKAKIFFANDDDPSYRREEILGLFDIVILPVHDLATISAHPQYEWMGYPTKKSRRNYTVGEFLAASIHKKRWSMGWRRLTDLSILQMQGLDTTLPTAISRYGKVIFPDGTEHVIRSERSAETLIMCSFMNMDFYLRAKWYEQKKAVEAFQKSQG